MKKLIIAIGAVLLLAHGVVPVMATAVSTTDITNAIARVETAIAEVGSEADTLKDAKGVSIRNHVNYLERQVILARLYLNGCLGNADVEEIYDALNEGATALTYLAHRAQTMVAADEPAAQVAETTPAQGTATVAAASSTFIPKVPMAGSVAK